MFNMHPLTDEEQKVLEAKCQKNGWLKRGGYDWQDDPFLEEYPYEFDRCFSMEDLRDFFRQGNWAIRQGVVYGDLAFIQQVNGGDEWWTLKKDEAGNWHDFESISFKRIASDISELTRYIAGMRLATVEECKHLDYLPPESDMQWTGNAFPYLDDGYVTARNCDFRIHVEQNHIGKLLTVNAPSEDYAVDQGQDGQTLLGVINAQIEAANRYKSERLPSLSEQTQEAVLASANQQKAERAAEARTNVR